MDMSIHTGKYVPYLRVSTDAQGADGYGIDAQRQAINRHLNGGDWELLEEFVEVESGKKTMRKRPVLNKAIEYALAHDATVIVAKIDRMTRSVGILHDILRSGVRIIFCDVPDMGNPSTNRLILNVMATIAEFEGARISERTRDGLAAAKSKGKVLGSPNPQAGAAAANRKRMTAADEHALEVGPRIKKARKAGASSYREIAEALANLGIQTSRGGFNWQPTSVRNTERRYDELTGDENNADD
jgi:DNA invertase Pin-like site-specific DNA recombinase